MAQGILTLDPGYSPDGMVLQRTTDATQDGDCILSGFIGKGEEVVLRWPGLGRDITPEMVPRGDRIHWFILHKHFRNAGARLAPGGPLTLVFTHSRVTSSWGKAKRTPAGTSIITNVWIGDVWIVAQDPHLCVPAGLGGLRARLASIVPRVFQADMVWGQPPRVPDHWRPCDPEDLAGHWPMLCYALADAVGYAQPVPLGLILTRDPVDMLASVPPVEVPQALAQDLVLKETRAALLGGWRQSSNDWQGLAEAFKTNIASFRRRIQPVPPASVPPSAPDFPPHVYPGTPTNVAYRVRGAFY